jgi:hypothetical protein
MWAFRKDPFMTLGLIVTRGWIFLRAFWNVTRVAFKGRQIQRLDEESDLVPLPADVTKKIAALAHEQAEGSRLEWIGGTLLILLVVLVVALIVAAGISFLGGLWSVGAACLVVAAVLYVVRLIASRRLPSFDDLMFRVAQGLKETLGSEYAVRYIVLGHDHTAAIEPLGDAWYVNTGTWVQIFEQKGPIEAQEKLTFFRLAWEYEGVPELLCWDDAVGEPACLRLGLFE